MNVPDDPRPAAIPPPLPAPTPDAVPRVRRWRWWLHLVLIAVYPPLLGLLATLLGAEDGTGEPALTGGSRGLLWVCGETLLVFAVVFGIAWFASRATRDDLLLCWRGGFRPVPLGLGYSLALRFGLGAIAVAVAVALVVLRVTTPEELQGLAETNRPNVEAIVDVAALRNDPAYFWLMITLVSFVVAGLREELWRAAFLAGVRALWPQRFASRGAQIGAVAIAAVAFGIGHAPQGLVGATMAGLLGFGLGVIMILHRSIWPAVIAHGFFDATSFALIPYAMEKMQEWQRALP